MIDGNLTEINVTSPTGIRAIARLNGPDVGRENLGCDRGEAGEKIVGLPGLDLVFP